MQFVRTKLLPVVVIASAITTTGLSAQAHILDRIARCESDGTQYASNGKVKRNPSSPRHVGLFQIDEVIHGREAKRLRLNIYTPTGNRAYAMHLYRLNGVRDWTASRHCWGQQVAKR